MIANPWLAMGITLGLCLAWMRIINFLTDKNIIHRSFSRKIIHIGTGPIFVLCWILFPDNPASKFLAAFVPFLIVLQLFLVGIGKIKDRTSILSMARSGNRAELLRGPFLYGVAFVLITIFFWKTIHAVVALMILCGGDGVADLIGSRIKSYILPWTKRKTIGGSIAMLTGGFFLSLAIILLVKNYFFPTVVIKIILLPLLGISFVSTLVESTSPSDWDNMIVPAVSLALSFLFL